MKLALEKNVKHQNKTGLFNIILFLFLRYKSIHIPSDKRATVLSTVSMFRNLALIIFNPIVGALADFSLSYTLIGLGFIVIIFSFISRIEEDMLID